MEGREDERLSAETGLVATVAVGVGTFVSGLGDAPGVEGASAGAWWAAYLLFAVAFALDADIGRRRPRWATDRRLLAIEILAAAAAWMVAPGLGWTAALFVVSAGSAAYALTARGAFAVVAAQSTVIAAGTALDGQSAPDVLLATAVYGGFQGFAVLVIRSERRAVAARAELAAAHLELRAATIALGASARNAERLRISRDLHDAVGHQLTALALELEVASHRDGGSAAHTALARAITKDLLRDVRAAVDELRVGTTQLEPTLQQLVAGLPGPAIDLTVDERAALDETHALAVVRCVQEVVTNTLRHAGADHLTISVVVDDAVVVVDACDDGRGAERLVPGNGLTGMRERIEQLGGEVAVRTAAGQGFAVEARVPVP